jgi:large subunit ribosomal protein L21
MPGSENSTAARQQNNYKLVEFLLPGMLAVIKTGGKQYFVAPGQKIKIEKIDKKEGAEIIFSEVLLLEKNKKVEIGNPTLKGVKVTGKILEQGKAKKVIVFKYKSKKRYKVKKGHRQPYTEVEITKIETK